MGGPTRVPTLLITMHMTDVQRDRPYNNAAVEQLWSINTALGWDLEVPTGACTTTVPRAPEALIAV